MLSLVIAASIHTVVAILYPYETSTEEIHLTAWKLSTNTARSGECGLGASHVSAPHCTRLPVHGCLFDLLVLCLCCLCT